jgi:hypothetical protein
VSRCELTLFFIRKDEGDQFGYSIALSRDGRILFNWMKSG